MSDVLVNLAPKYRLGTTERYRVTTRSKTKAAKRLPRPKKPPQLNKLPQQSKLPRLKKLLRPSQPLQLCSLLLRLPGSEVSNRWKVERWHPIRVLVAIQSRTRHAQAVEYTYRVGQVTT